MNTASLELCKELYELSGWDGDTKLWWHTWSSGRDEVLEPVTPHEEDAPAYDLGYLLRQLPNVYVATGKTVRGDKTQMLIEFGFGIDRIRAAADTPEDAAAELAIELFKQGILKRDG